MNSKVLIIMPCYNTQDTILRTLLSIKNQIYKNFKLVCCDDASTDNTLNILIDNKSLINNIEIIENKINLGTGNSINNCIDITLKREKFKYITWVSADNILHDNFVLEHVNLLNKNYDITYSGWEYHLNNNEKSLNFRYPNRDLLHLKSCYELGPSFMFTPEVFKKAGPFNSLPGEDYYFAVNCALNNFKFGYIDKVLVNYKIHDNSITAKLKRRELIDICSLEAKGKAQNIIGNIK